MELFAGSRSATRAVSMAGYRATCIDIEDYKGYGISKGPGSPFDILSTRGFAKLSSIQTKFPLKEVLGVNGVLGPRARVKGSNLEPLMRARADPGPLSKDSVSSYTNTH